jgi:hypothetical protein
MADKPIKFTNEDWSLLNRIMDLHPEFREIATIVKRVTASCKFPINSFDDLAEGLGGEDASIAFRGRSMTVGQIRKMVPAYYFPIATDRDLIAKLGEMQGGMESIKAPVQVSSVSDNVEVKFSTQYISLPHDAPPHPPLSSQQIFEALKEERTGIGVRHYPG